jgi:hypothetical protein
MDLKALAELPPWDWPPDAGAAIEEVLRDRAADGSHRLLAAELAGEWVVMSDDVVTALRSVVESADEPDPLRARAAIALGPALEYLDLDAYLDDPEDRMVSEEVGRSVRAALRAVYRDSEVPDEVRRRVLEASVRAPEDWHPEAVRAAYYSEDADWQRTAVFCMGKVSGFDTEILEALKSGRPDLLYEAVRALDRQDVEEAWPYVRHLLVADGVDKPLLLAAILAAGNLRPEEAPEMLDHLADSDDEEIAEAVSEALLTTESLMEDLDDPDYIDPDDDDPTPLFGPHGNGTPTDR